MGMHRGTSALAVVASLVAIAGGTAPAHADGGAIHDPVPVVRPAVAGAVPAAASTPLGRASAAPAALGGTWWRAVQLRDPSGDMFWVRRSVAPRMLFFRDGGVSGFTGCNWYSYRTRYSPPRGLKIRAGVTTTAGCDATTMSTEIAFGDALYDVRRYVRQGRTLSLLDKSGATLVVLRRIHRTLPKP
jgi:heat shock protein HslJ